MRCGFLINKFLNLQIANFKICNLFIDNTLELNSDIFMMQLLTLLNGDVFSKVT